MSSELVTLNDLKEILENFPPNNTADRIYCCFYNFLGGDMLNRQDCTTGVQIDSTGAIVTDANYMVTDFLPVKAYAAIQLVFTANTTENIRVAGYDSNGNYIRMSYTTKGSASRKTVKFYLGTSVTFNEKLVTHIRVSFPTTALMEIRGYKKVTLQSALTKSLQSIEDIGTTYYASSSKAITTAGIDTHTQGAYITLPPGIYVVTAQWIFNTRSSSANTNSQCSIKNLETGSILTSQRYLAAGYNYNVIQTGGMWPITSTTRLAVMGSSSITYTSATTNWIHAVKIADYHM